ncbi:hypothetical protein SAMN05892883_2403 [Jatrophihabitans sp. GAS493]|uniref:LysM peptidoglycan-binding domain-containing protein n=1 Tax=Jatrophihabitans sp. GAS493 TaxID=1907575 RepID=UPI000BC037BE|nr:hypothetical protein [Jatrophihabitans sp. GAS493]SOD73109.1 hypothetical protein SAMN05892883_2403 [Jatrophihabitans sp. GAS493]
MNNIKRYPLAALLCIVDGFVLIRLRPDWHALTLGVRGPHAWVAQSGADLVAAKLAGCALWLIAIWFGLGILAALGTALPGAAGRTLQIAASRLLPRAMLRLVAGASGLGVLLAPVAAQASTPAPPAAVQSVIGSSVATPLPAPALPTDPTSAPTPIATTTPRLTIPSPSPNAATPSPAVHPTATPTPAATPRGSTAAIPATPTAGQPGSTPPTPVRPVTAKTDAPKTQERSVTVAPGDSLWLIAAHRLGASASNEQIAAEWPRWYAANAAAIGTDPGLIHPGSVLQAPADQPSTSPAS